MAARCDGENRLGFGLDFLAYDSAAEYTAALSRINPGPWE